MHLKVAICFDRKIDRKMSCFEMMSSRYKVRLLHSVLVSITYEKNKIEDIKQMKATNLPDIGINESLKICYNMPHNFCYNLPRGHDALIWHLAKRSY